MQKIWYLAYMFLQCTWGIIQTSIGFLLFLRYFHTPHKFFYGTVHTSWKRRDGVSLGLFIFSPECKNRMEDDWMVTHEYGHTFQSLLLGPFYFIIIGIPSAIWANGKRYIHLRETYGGPYSFMFAEGWADHLGEKMKKRFGVCD